MHTQLIAVGYLAFGECVGPKIPNPPHRLTDIVTPKFVITRHDQVDPEVLVGLQEYDAAATSATHDSDAITSTDLFIDNVCVLL